MYTSIGVLQRDAPALGHRPDFQQLPRQMATDLAAAHKAFNAILGGELQSHFEGYRPGEANWPSADEIRAILEERIGEVREGMVKKQARATRIQAFYQQYTDELFTKK